MKIQGPNHSNFNPYQKQLQKQADMKQQAAKADQLQISDQAKQLQGSDKPSDLRQKQVDQIKQSVQSGDYSIDPKKTSQKMLEFWSNQV
ncbi:flagellar biosynthesis anti-sigma factor FlgM [Aquibacillus halophilus]|uniref:Negative regulator of flagellin synthesis n=1 Tax=Aquibacillus halophilus TaxID=930132 RepID=A0A6A8D8P6_9BACI|nr:flagellar biosynthesis anti-sigma factor FlgM [Aquibacillus halophilus]MRH41968.1 flagellar biosynthesis anti-sigma factor FlgM [Aquibacillus halophilus]